MPRRADRRRSESETRQPLTLADVEPGRRVRVEVTVIGGKGYLGGIRVEIQGRDDTLPDDLPVELVAE